MLHRYVGVSLRFVGESGGWVGRSSQLEYDSNAYSLKCVVFIQTARAVMGFNFNSIESGKTC